MSVYLTPVTFEGQHIAPSDDGAAWAACTTDGISSGCALAVSNGNLTIATGKVIAAGRTAKLESASSFALTGSGYDRLVLTVDLSKDADKVVALDLENVNSFAAAFTGLTQNDVNGSGTKYQFVVCVVNGGSIIWECGAAHSKGYGTSVTIATGDWSSNQATKYVNGVTANSKVIVTPAPASQALCDANGVIAYSQADGSITFKCTSVPSGSVTFNILLY